MLTTAARATTLLRTGAETRRGACGGLGASSKGDQERREHADPVSRRGPVRRGAVWRDWAGQGGCDGGDGSAAWAFLHPFPPVPPPPPKLPRTLAEVRPLTATLVRKERAISAEVAERRRTRGEGVRTAGGEVGATGRRRGVLQNSGRALGRSLPALMGSTVSARCRLVCRPAGNSGYVLLNV